MTKKLVYGIGINDSRRPVRNREIGWICPYYSKWQQMLKKAQTSGDNVCADWRKFSRFRLWIHKQDFAEKVMVNIKKTYSPATTAFFKKSAVMLIKKGEFDKVTAENDSQARVLNHLINGDEGVHSLKNTDTAAILRALKKCINPLEKKVTISESEYQKTNGATTKQVLDHLHKNPKYRHIKRHTVYDRLSKLCSSGALYPCEESKIGWQFFPVGYLKQLKREFAARK